MMNSFPREVNNAHRIFIWRLRKGLQGEKVAKCIVILEIAHRERSKYRVTERLSKPKMESLRKEADGVITIKVKIIILIIRVEKQSIC